MAKYFAARVSSKDQNLARQLETAKKLGIPLENVFCDKVSGRKKDRPEYDRLKTIVKPGDEVYFESLDRIGREKSLIKGELEWFKANKVFLRILDIPTSMIEMPKEQEWVFEMVNNILIEVLSAVAEQEWVKIKSRRDAGIDAMPLDEDGYKVSSRTGNRFGRAKIVPENFKEVYKRQQRGELSLKEALEEVGVGRTRWYELVKEVA